MTYRYYFAPIALAGVFIGLCAGAFAQTAPSNAPAPSISETARPHHHGHGHNRMRAALAALDLSPDQKAKIAAMVRADRTAFRASLAPQTKPTRDERHAYDRKLRTDVESILTADQKTRFEAALAHHRHRRDVGPMPQPSPN